MKETLHDLEEQVKPFYDKHEYREAGDIVDKLNQEVAESGLDPEFHGYHLFYTPQQGYLIVQGKEIDMSDTVDEMGKGYKKWGR